MNYENKRLYVDVSKWGAPTRYVTFSIDLLDWLIEQNLSTIEMNLFLSIAMRYDNAHESQRKPQGYSYADLAELGRCSKNAVINAIKNLIDKKLLRCVNKDERAGRGKLLYMPDIENIHNALKAYVNKS